MIVDESTSGSHSPPFQSRLRPRLRSHGLYIEPAPRAIICGSIGPILDP
jgi:hypothetical protein